MHDLLDEVTGLLVVHGPNFFDALVICLFKFFETLLEFDKLIGELLVLLCAFGVCIPGFGLLNSKLFDLFTKFIHVRVLLRPEALLLLREDILTLVENIVVEGQLLLIELVNGLHVLHALFEDLHLGLQLDLLLSLLVSVLAHDVFELLGVGCLLLLPLVQVAGFDLLMLIEEVLNLLFVPVEDSGSLTIKL